MLIAVLVGGCGSDSEGGGTFGGADQPRDDDITAMIDELWAATDARAADVSIGRYRYEFAPNSTSCADLDDDDRWLGVRRSTVGPGVLAEGDVERQWTDTLEARGFTVTPYRSTHPDDPVRALDAVQGDMRVTALLTPDGPLDLTVQAGPCAPTFGGLDLELYEPDV